MLSQGWGADRSHKGATAGPGEQGRRAAHLPLQSTVIDVDTEKDVFRPAHPATPLPQDALTLSGPRERWFQASLEAAALSQHRANGGQERLKPPI